MDSDFQATTTQEGILPPDSLPVLVEAWSTAFKDEGSGAEINPQLQEYLTANPSRQKEMIRELYMYLQAKQLVAITSRLDDISKTQHRIHRRVATKKPCVRWWGLGWTGLLSLTMSGAALALGGFVALRGLRR
jgi:hypothetical protein